MALLEEQEQKKAAGFQHCSECSSPFPASDKHCSCLKCLGPNHLSQDCKLCRSMDSRALRNREQRLRELFGGRSLSPTPLGSNGHHQVAESDQSDPTNRASQSLQRHVSTRRGKVVSKALKKSFPKQAAPASSPSAPAPRVTSEPGRKGTPEAPAPDGSGDAPVFLDPELELGPESYPNASALEIPDPKPRSTLDPARSDAKKKQKHKFSRDCFYSLIRVPCPIVTSEDEDSGGAWGEVEEAYVGEVSDAFYTSTSTDSEQGIKADTPAQDSSFRGLIEKMTGVLALELSSASQADQSHFMQLLQGPSLRSRTQVPLHDIVPTTLEGICRAPSSVLPTNRQVDWRYLVPEGEGTPLAFHPSAESTVASAANDQARTRQKKNVAQQGTATQSSLLATEKYERAANAIDGRKDNTYYSASCTHTKHELSPWWRLQLNKSYKISTIKITNRGECCAMRLQGAEIHVGDTLNVTKNPKLAPDKAVEIDLKSKPCDPEMQLVQLYISKLWFFTKCGTFTSNVAGATETFCCNGMEGRYVTIVIPGRKEYLTLCEVEAFVVPAQCQKFSGGIETEGLARAMGAGLRGSSSPNGRQTMDIFTRVPHARTALHNMADNMTTAKNPIFNL
nr:PREDICTED: uncharacterized protein LOC102355748 [Latimeria chalumnae]|eukprot:XP_014344326.1 PREDICTED: uncharacterized protein LOC102355748 [Latimeria chalumnae]